MSVEEAKSAIEELKSQGASEEEIASSFYLMFTEGKLDVNQLDALLNLLGYHLKDEFKEMDEEKQKSAGFKEVDKEEVEEAKEPEDDEEEKAMKLFGK